MVFLSMSYVADVKRYILYKRINMFYYLFKISEGQMKLKYSYLMLFIFLILLFFQSNILFSQDTQEKVFIGFIYFYADILYTSMTQEDESEFLYLMKYSGANIENGIEKYISSYSLKFKDKKFKENIGIYTHEEVDKIVNYVENLLGYVDYKNIFYLAIAWNICDNYEVHYDFLFSLKGSRNDFEKLNEHQKVKYEIESRANILLLSFTTNRRLLLSLFDRRTYRRLGL